MDVFLALLACCWISYQRTGLNLHENAAFMQYFVMTFEVSTLKG